MIIDDDVCFEHELCSNTWTQGYTISTRKIVFNLIGFMCLNIVLVIVISYIMQRHHPTDYDDIV